MSAIAPKFIEAAIGGGADADLMSGDVRVVAVEGTYVWAEDHEFLSSVPVADRAAVSDPLTNKSVTDGIFDADPGVFAVIPAAPEAVTQYLIVVMTGVDATSRIVMQLDDASLGLPFVPTGAGQLVEWDDGPNKIGLF